MSHHLPSLNTRESSGVEVRRPRMGLCVRVFACVCICVSACVCVGICVSIWVTAISVPAGARGRGWTRARARAADCESGDWGCVWNSWARAAGLFSGDARLDVDVASSWFERILPR